MILKLTKKNSINLNNQLTLDLLNVDQIVVSDKFKHSDDGFKYLLVTKKGMLLNRYVLLTSNEWIHQILCKRWQKHVFCD